MRNKVSDAAHNTEAELASTPPKRDKRKLIFVVVLVTLFAIWMVPDDEEPIEPITKPELLVPLASDGNTDAQQPADGLAGSPVAGNAARGLIGQLNSENPADLERAFTTAQQHMENSQQDDAYLLYFYAARAGHGKSALTLAQHADPNHFKPNGLYPRADAGQAYKWYKKAAEFGEPQATPALQALRTTVETAAANGDSRAQRMVLQWQ